MVHKQSFVDPIRRVLRSDLDVDHVIRSRQRTAIASVNAKYSRRMVVPEMRRLAFRWLHHDCRSDG
jgi:hypothetical protein